ncbi:hypothetical protein LHJ74_31410 [Streptomyces sp. N2-109]|uniref:Integral membrane protein n=1 Tax=Streptomyces gossypii TaxID=2883101 RepID=A0ABT2K422_9ACTN|nr:HGxxPAAW family protein [Streptomyces gossypii]MCT2594364.1 hypothetical protein [Streptomyces gossypii]
MAGNNHGHSLAAWTGVIIAVIGFTVAGMFTVMAEPLGVLAGGVVIVLSGLIGLAMRAAGMGVPRAQTHGQAQAESQTQAQGQAQAAQAQA